MKSKPSIRQHLAEGRRQLSYARSHIAKASLATLEAKLILMKRKAPA